MGGTAPGLPTCIHTRPVWWSLGPGTSVLDDLNSAETKGAGASCGCLGLQTDPDRGGLKTCSTYCSHSSGSQKSEITGWRGGPLGALGEGPSLLLLVGAGRAWRSSVGG